MNNESKFTPGPWNYGRNSREIYAHGISICRLSPGMLYAAHAADPATQDANAALIAAAPDLLAALKLALSENGRTVEQACDDVALAPWEVAARAAIAKADGREP